MTTTTATSDTTVDAGQILARIVLADGTDTIVDYVGTSRHGALVYRIPDPAGDGYGEFGEIAATAIAEIHLPE